MNKNLIIKNFCYYLLTIIINLRNYLKSDNAGQCRILLHRTYLVFLRCGLSREMHVVTEKDCVVRCEGLTGYRVQGR